MLKSYKNYQRKNKKKFKLFKTAQSIIPVDEVYEDGIFREGKNYSICYTFSDVNYFMQSKDKKESMMLNYGEMLNSFDSNVAVKITINNRTIDLEKFKKSVLLEEVDDEFKIQRKEYNEFLLSKLSESNNIIQEKYITLSLFEEDIKSARQLLLQAGNEISIFMSTLGSKCIKLNALDRLKIFHDFFRSDEEFNFNLKKDSLRGRTFKDVICPYAPRFNMDYFQTNEKYGRVLWLEQFPSINKDKSFNELCKLDKNVMLTIDLLTMPTDEAIDFIEQKLLGANTNEDRYLEKKREQNNFNARPPIQLRKQIEELEAIHEQITENDQKIIMTQVTLVHLADSLEELNEDSQKIKMNARGCGIKMSPLYLSKMQLEGLQTVLPFGVDKIDYRRTLLTDGASSFIPFYAQNVMDEGGIYYGQNAITNKPVLINIQNLLNQNALVFGVPGSGKSFLIKMLIEIIRMTCPDDDILICDPEGEYNHIVKKYGGQVIEISASTGNYINAMDLEDGYGESKNPIADKSQFILSVFDEITASEGGLEQEERSIIDRCVIMLYEKFKKIDRKPTLRDLKDTLLEQQNVIAAGLALKLEMYSDGSLDLFAHETNFDTSSNFISFDISKLSQQLKKVGLLVMLDAILNRVNKNWKLRKKTHLFIDEFHFLFENETSMNFFNSAWRQFRKRNTYSTAITQNIKTLLESDKGQSMIDNTQFVILLNQGENDLERVSQLFNMSKEQKQFVNHVKAGHGLIKYGSLLIPFKNEIDKDMQMYKDNTTKPDEMNFGETVDE